MLRAANYHLGKNICCLCVCRLVGVCAWQGSAPERFIVAVLDKGNDMIKEVRVDNPRDGALVRTMGSGADGEVDGTFATGGFRSITSLSFSSEGALFVKDYSKIRIVDWNSNSGNLLTTSWNTSRSYVFLFTCVCLCVCIQWFKCASLHVCVCELCMC